MKKLFLTALIISITFVQSGYSYISNSTRWNTTKGYNRYGNCQLESNSIKVKIRGCSIDVEEEAVIKTIGNVPAGDPNTLEITGTFVLSEGAVVRSLLLWNGDDILKAKLLDKKKADDLMDSIVNNTAVDPALIRYEGDNCYSFRIYPVAINNSRKVRILYTIPLKANSGQFKYEFRPAFTMGCSSVPSQIPIKFENSCGDSTRYKLNQNSAIKNLQFGVTYLIPYEDIASSASFIKYIYGIGNSTKYCYRINKPISIESDTTIFEKSFTSFIDTSETKGHYSAIFSKTPDSLKAIIKHAVIPNYTLEAKILTSDNGYITALPENGIFSIYLKSNAEWDKNVYWTVYSSTGDPLINYTQSFNTDTSRDNNNDLPMLWGGQYSLVEGQGDLGAAFGFVDSKMSLLALERDTLTKDIAVLYKNSGVPLLLPEDIIADLTNVHIPSENIIIEATDIKLSMKEAIKNILMQITQNNMLKINLGTLDLQNLNIGIYDMRGRLIKSFKDLRVDNHSISLKLPHSADGMFIVRVNAGDVNFTRKLIVK